MRVALIAMAVALVAVSATGCAALRSGQPAPLTPVAEPMTTDLVIPSGFKINMKRSYFSSMGGVRVGRLLYVGRADAGMLVNFYRDNMPISGWTLRREASDFASFVLEFEKGAEGVEVRITPRRMSSEVAISIHRGGGR